VKGLIQSPVVTLVADAATEVATLSVSGAVSPGQPETAGLLGQFLGRDFGFAVSGDVAFNDVDVFTDAVIRDTTVKALTVSLSARDNTAVAAGAGAVTFANHAGIGGAFARNGLERATRAHTQDVAFPDRTQGDTPLTTLTVTANADDHLFTVTEGGSGA